MNKIILFILFFSFPLQALEISNQKLKTLYVSLDPTSIAQHLAFYELYANHELGQKALKNAWQILAGQPLSYNQARSELPFSSSVINSLVNLINKQNDQELPLLEEKDLKEIEKFSCRLLHKKLKGHYALSEEELLLLPSEEIDLAHGLFLSEMGPDYRRIRSYEALLDIMALQVLARLPPQPTPTETIQEINHLIFEEMHFRFPPQSLFSKDIDIYTFLPSVLDSRRGVCLGVSIVYLCLAQRLGLTMEIITPPGHIYVRYRNKEQIINVETTARGIHLDSEEYLSIDTHALQHRNIKETIGLAHFNQAAIYWQQNDHEKARQAYLRALPYLQQDCLLKELMGYTCLLTNRREEGERLLKEIKDHIPEYAISKNTIAEDYFLGHVDAESLKLIFQRTEDNRSSILAHKNALEEVVKRYPLFRNGLILLAMHWIKLHRYGKGLEILKNYYEIDTQDPEVNYYLAVLYKLQFNYPQAWHHLQQTEKILQSKNYYPKILKDFRYELLKEYPEPISQGKAL